jgi:hypothetical protein
MAKFTKAIGLLTLAVASTAAGAPPTSATSKRTAVMPEFALIFRPGGAVDPADLPRRNVAARDWALALRRQGTLHAASPLEDNGFVVNRAGVLPLSGDRAVASVLVIAAKDLNSAVALAKGHPGLAFGTEIEVRPVKAVALPPR